MIKKFEKYAFDYDGDITTEYAKYIISRSIDELKPLENLKSKIEETFYDIASSELEDTWQREAVAEELKSLLEDLKGIKFNTDDDYIDYYKTKKDRGKYNL